VTHFDTSRPPADPIDRRNRWAVRGSALAVGILVGFLALWSGGLDLRGWSKWLHRDKPAPKNPRAAIVPVPATVKNVRHEDPKARLGTDSSASPIPLRLRLIRTVPGRSIHEGEALLGVDRDHPQTYMAGAILENGARLDEIYHDHIVLAKGTRHTSLYLDINGSETDAAPADTLAMVGGPASKVESPHLSVEPITDYLRPVPIYRNGAISGFQLYPGIRTTVFNKWGLQPGDVMIALDGQPLGDADRFMDILRGLMEGEALTATVQRNADTLSLTLDGAEVERIRTANNSSPIPPRSPAMP
jgi:general secretion pathway protein C